MIGNFLTIWGLWKYDPTIFDNLHLPEGVDKDTAVNTILIKSAELEILYPDSSFLKEAIGYWSLVECEKWTRILRTLSAEYNPVENYDRTDRTTVTDTRGVTETETRNLARTKTGTIENENVSSGTTSSEGSILNKQNGFNDPTGSSLKEHDSSNTTGSNSSSGTGSGTETYNTTDSDSGTVINAESGQNILVTEVHAHGNIGVTTGPQLQKERMDIDIISIYDIIANAFKNHFNILVY